MCSNVFKTVNKEMLICVQCAARKLRGTDSKTDLARFGARPQQVPLRGRLYSREKGKHFHFVISKKSFLVKFPVFVNWSEIKMVDPFQI